jgi:MYXO-CTERM domain-containing protein
LREIQERLLAHRLQAQHQSTYVRSGVSSHVAGVSLRRSAFSIQGNQADLARVTAAVHGRVPPPIQALANRLEGSLKKTVHLCVFTLTTLLAVSVAPSTAASIIFSGADAGGGVGGPRVNADAAHAAWLAAAGSIGATEDFEGIATGSVAPLNLAGGMTLTTVGAPVENGASLNQVTDNQDPQIGYNTTAAGTNYFRFSPAFGQQATLTITFDVPVDAFGVYVTGIQAGFGTTTASWGSDNFLLPDTQGAPGFAGVQFFGFVSDAPIGSISFTTVTGVGSRDIMGFDDLQVAASAPEPTTGALALIGLVGAAVRRRRR